MSATNYSQRRPRDFVPKVQNDKIKSGPKKVLPPPSQVLDVLLDFVVHFHRLHLFYFSLTAKATIYFVFTSFFSLLAPFMQRGFMIPKTLPYFARKQNPLNVWFVKFGLIWTLSLVAAFIYFSGMVFTGGKLVVVVKRHLSRLSLATIFWWLFSSYFFGMVEKRSKSCFSAKGAVMPLTSETDCVVSGGFIHSYDVSGHCFLLIFCALIITEELRVFLGWSRLKLLLDRYSTEEEMPAELNHLEEVEVATIRRYFDKYSVKVKFYFIINSSLCFMWEFMVVFTIFYHHTFMEKTVGAICAIVAWYLLYHVICPLMISLPYDVCIWPPGTGSLVRYESNLVSRNIDTLIGAAEKPFHSWAEAMQRVWGRKFSTNTSARRNTNPSVGHRV